jgi:tripartite-type tricarboxylate transporter receptor subunit TctC
MAPLGTAEPITSRVHADAMRVLAEPEIRARMISLGLDIVGGTGEQMRETIAGDIRKWQRVISESGIRLTQ